MSSVDLCTDASLPSDPEFELLTYNLLLDVSSLSDSSSGTILRLLAYLKFPPIDFCPFSDPN